MNRLRELPSILLPIRRSGNGAADPKFFLTAPFLLTGPSQIFPLKSPLTMSIPKRSRKKFLRTGNLMDLKIEEESRGTERV
jgi:hypothetical protein